VPHHAQFKKSLRKEAKRNLRNRMAKSRLRTMVKKVRTAPSKEEAEKILRQAVSVIDSTARKGIIKKTTAARKKSRLYKFINTME